MKVEENQHIGALEIYVGLFERFILVSVIIYHCADKTLLDCQDSILEFLKGGNFQFQTGIGEIRIGIGINIITKEVLFYQLSKASLAFSSLNDIWIDGLLQGFSKKLFTIFPDRPFIGPVIIEIHR